MQRPDIKFWFGIGLALVSLAPGISDGIRIMLAILGGALIFVSVATAVLRMLRQRFGNLPAPSVTATRTAYDAIQSINTLPKSLGGNDVLRLGTLATLRRSAPYSLEMVTLVLDAVPMYLPGRADDKITVEDLSVTKGRLVSYVFDTAENKRHEISVAGRTYIVTLMESKKLDTPNVSNPIEWVFGITER